MHDDDYGRLLLRPLAGDPTGPPRIDVPRAMRDGHRLRHRRWWTGGAGLLAAVVAATVSGSLLLAPAGEKPHPKPGLPPDPAVPASCTMTRLPKGDNKTVEVSAGDSSGRWQVGSAAPVANSRGPILVWHDGKIVATVPQPATHNRIMNDINSSGVAVGTDDRLPELPYVLRDGKVSVLKGGAGEAQAINDQGVIAGLLIRDGKRVPVRWASADAEPEILPVPARGNMLAHIADIAPDGTIAAGEPVGVLWLPDGTVREIAPPGAAGFWAGGFAYGWLYGEATGAAPSPAPGGVTALKGAWRYEPRSGTWQHLDNDRAQVQYPGTFWAGAAQIFVGGKALKLSGEPVIGAGDDYTVKLSSVSADARVVTGTAISSHADPSLAFQPLIWHCR